jgi:hypothetical protein
MPQVPQQQATATDYYLVIGLMDSGGVMGATQVFIATGATEEDAITKVAPLIPQATKYVAQVMPTFDPPVGYPKTPPPPK